MTLKKIGEQQNVSKIDVDSSLSPQTENGIHLIQYQNIEALRKMVQHRTVDLTNGNYQIFHRQLFNWWRMPSAMGRNGGFNLKMYNYKMIGLDLGLINPVKNDVPGSLSQLDKEFEYQKYGTYLFSDRNGDPLKFPVNQQTYDYYWDGVNYQPEYISTKFFFKSLLDTQVFDSGYVESYNPSVYSGSNSDIPILGIIVEHNLDKDDPFFIVVGWNSSYELGVYSYTKAGGFVQNHRIYFNPMLLAFTCGRYRLMSNNLKFHVIRKPKRSLHYGVEFDNSVSRDKSTFYNDEASTQDIMDIDIEGKISDVDADQVLGIFTNSPLYQLVNFEWGYDFEGF